MSKNTNLKHWYDGWFYSKFIIPNQMKYFLQAINWMDNNFTVLDIACATGDFTMLAAKRAKKAVGIDLSKKNIAYANTESNTLGLSNVEFIHGDATKLSEIFDEQFDYSFISFALHEMPVDIREQVLKEAIKVSKRIIIADFRVDMPINMMGIISRSSAFFAGREHFTNFLSFRRNGGLNSLMNKYELKELKKKKKANNTSEIILMERL